MGLRATFIRHMRPKGSLHRCKEMKYRTQWQRDMAKTHLLGGVITEGDSLVAGTD
jgi:hypothetical protein